MNAAISLRDDGITALLKAARSFDFWATPSHVPGLPTLDPRDDQSISNRAIGSLLEHNNGVRALEELIAHARGAKRAWPLINGSTGGNHIVMLALARSHPAPKVLVAGNCHHSVLNAAMSYGVRLRFLPAKMITGFDAILPPTAEDIRAALDRDPSVTALIVTDPTYEGLHGNISSIAAAAHDHGLPLIVDAAWGAHFGYHPLLPAATATTGADVVIESLHKTGGAGQGCAAILHAGPYLDQAAIEASFTTLVTTSPSFTLLSTIEWALTALSTSGEQYLQAPIEQAHRLRDGLRERGLPVLDHNLLADPTKVTFGSVHGFAVENLMLKRGVVVEKASSRSVLMLATMQLAAGAADRALSIIDEILPVTLDVDGAASRLLDVRSHRQVPVTWLTDTPAVEAHEAVRGLPTETVPTANAVGRIAAETVELYPPGVPVLAPGWVIQGCALDELERACAAGARIVASDRSLGTLLVLK